MTLIQLSYIITIAETGSLTKTAEQKLLHNVRLEFHPLMDCLPICTCGEAARWLEKRSSAREYACECRFVHYP